MASFAESPTHASVSPITLFSFILFFFFFPPTLFIMKIESDFDNVSVMARYRLLEPHPSYSNWRGSTLVEFILLFFLPFSKISAPVAQFLFVSLHFAPFPVELFLFLFLDCYSVEQHGWTISAWHFDNPQCELIFVSATTLSNNRINEFQLICFLFCTSTTTAISYLLFKRLLYTTTI